MSRAGLQHPAHAAEKATGTCWRLLRMICLSRTFSPATSAVEPSLADSSERGIFSAESIPIDVPGMADTAAEQQLLRSFVVQYLLNAPGHLSASWTFLNRQLQAAGVCPNGQSGLSLSTYLWHWSYTLDPLQVMRLPLMYEHV